jgi:exonuclease III
MHDTGDIGENGHGVTGPLAQRQSSGLLIHWFRVRIPGGPPKNNQAKTGCCPIFAAWSSSFLDDKRYVTTLVASARVHILVENASVLQRKLSMLRIWSWNVNGRQLWDHLDANKVDVALLQEAPVPPSPWEGKVVPHPEAGWGTAGGAKWRRTAVVAVSETTRLEPRPLTSFEERASGVLLVSRQGTLAAADVVVDGERITLVSMYAAWEGYRPGPIYADASAHRLLSDLSGIVHDARSHRIVAAGDLNILHGYGDYGDSYWEARYATVFDRAEAMGLRFVGLQAPFGRQANPRPTELPEGSLNVPTYHTRQRGPMGATRQLDFVFASHALTDRLSVRALNSDPDEWGPSDHCRVAIELQT